MAILVRMTKVLESTSKDQENRKKTREKAIEEGVDKRKMKDVDVNAHVIELCFLEHEGLKKKKKEKKKRRFKSKNYRI